LVEYTLAAAFLPQRRMREPAGPIAFWHLCIERKKSLPFLILEDGFLHPLACGFGSGLDFGFVLSHCHFLPSDIRELEKIGYVPAFRSGKGSRTR
jgi:hypothetical protein